MPAPELITQTPGEPIAAITPIAPSTDTTETAPQPQAPLYVAKHKGAGRWIAVTNDGASIQVGDFVGDKESIIPEVERLNAGGEPLVLDPQRLNEPVPKAKVSTTETVDATTLKQPVMTDEGWLCPESSVKG